jgi:hypothetical protein
MLKGERIFCVLRVKRKEWSAEFRIAGVRLKEIRWNFKVCWRFEVEKRKNNGDLGGNLKLNLQFWERY